MAVRGVGLVVAAVLGLVGSSACGAGDDGTGGAEAAAAEASPTPEGGTSAAPVPAVTPAERLEAGFALPGGPDWLAADDRGVVVNLADAGRVLRIDPQTDAVVDELDLEVEDPGCQGVGIAFDAVWACRDRALVRIDPEAWAVTATVELQKLQLQGSIPGAFGRVWVLAGDGSTLLGVDPATDAVADTIVLPARGSDVDVSADGVWVVSRPDSALLLVDPAAGAVRLRLDLDRPAALAAVDGGAYVSGGSWLSYVDAGAGAVVRTGAVGTGEDGSLAVDGDRLWLRSAASFLQEVDPSTLAPVGEVGAAVTSGGDVAVAAGSVWTTAYDDEALFRIAPD